MLDLRYALRQLRRSPGFTIVALLVLGLGIGVNASMFSVVNAVLFRPVAVESPERLVRIFTSEWESSGIPSRFHGASSLPDFEDLRLSLGDVMTGLAAWDENTVTVGGGESATNELAAFVTGDFFAAYGPRLMLGRGLVPNERRDDASVVIGERVWRTRFEGDSAVLGRAVTIAGESFTIVGVVDDASLAPMHDNGVDLVLPLAAYERIFLATDMMQGRSNRWLDIVGRLRPGVPIAQAQAAVTTAGARIGADYPAESGGRVYTVQQARTLIGFAGESSDSIRAVAAVMMAVAAIVLLIVCANVANLLLARASRRSREIAVRLALGATRRRLVRQLVVESLLLALLGAVPAVLIALWVADGVRLLPLPAGILPAVDGRVLAFTAAVAALSAFAFGLAPAFHGTRLGAAQTIQRAGGTTITRRRSRLRHALLVSQIALAFVLLVAAGLLGRTMRNMRDADPGFDVNRLLIAYVMVDGRRIDSVGARAAYERMLERLAAVPGVEGVSLATTVALGGGQSRSSVSIPGYEPSPTESMEIPLARVGPDYFATMGIPVVSGTLPRWDPDGAPAAVINEAMARRYWPGRDPVGATIRHGGAELVVTGVVRNAQFRSLTEPPRPMMFRTIGAGDLGGSLALHVRTSGTPANVAAAVRMVVAETAPEFELESLRPLADLSAEQSIPTLIASSAMGIFGTLALLLASIGLYGVMAFLASMRAPEVGIRMALGADRGSVRALFLREGGRVALIGVGTGVLLALAVMRVLASTLYGVPPWDPPTYLAIGTLLVAVALAASWIPAQRAAKLDPVTALKAE